jgi:hypothetical protein
MIYNNNNCSGIDCTINQTNKTFYNGLMALYEDLKMDSYSRCYEHQNMIYFNDELNEYKKDVFFNDNIDATSFFFTAPNIVVIKGLYKQRVTLFLTGYIDKFYPVDAIKKDDQKILFNVLNIIAKFTGNWDLVKVNTTAEEVFKKHKFKNFDLTDMSNMFCFSFEFDVIFDNCK